jgi:hypothetical protein
VPQRNSANDLKNRCNQRGVNRVAEAGFDFFEGKSA